MKRLEEELVKANEAREENLRLFEEMKARHASEVANFEPKVTRLEECLMEVLSLSVKIQGLETSIAERDVKVDQLVTEKEDLDKKVVRVETEVRLTIV